MPDANAEPPAANPPSVPPSAPTADKDRVGEEMADDARIWRVYDRIARADDRERISAWNRGLDNLALFAGLFSAVTTAFIIEAQKDMKVDYSQLAFLALNATANGVPFTQQPFVVPSGGRTITCLWVSSLLLSLSAALIAIMGKDWIGMYAARPVCNARQWAEMRTYRLLCVDRWYMSEVIASAPVLLHVSLLLFGAGLVLFISSDPLTHNLALGLALAAGSLYLVTALSAIAFPASPFKSPATQMIRGAFAATLRSLFFHPKCNIVATVHGAISRVIAHDLHSISRDQRRILPMFLFRDTNRLTEEGPNRLSALRRVRNFAYTAPLSTFVVSRQFLLGARRQMRPSKVASAWIGSQEFLIGVCRRIACAARSLLTSPLFVGSPWTTVRSHRSPARLAKALSWLNTASLEPEVLRAIIIALGDLEIGGEVAPLVSTDLRTRVRADIRFNWKKVDFLTLSRYVLADRNLPGNALIDYFRFKGRFKLRREPHLRCEDGLAAVVMVGKHCVLPQDVLNYCPLVVSQPRMFHWLLPHILGFRNGYEPLVDLVHCYRKSLSRRDIRDLEARFLQCFSPEMRKGYQHTVRTRFGNQFGLLELLIYLIVARERPDNDLATSAMAVVFHILMDFGHRDREHWCLAYIFSSDLSDSLWAVRGFTLQEAISLLNSLPLWTYRQYKCNDRDEPGPIHGQPIERALARTVIEILSPARWGRSDDLATHYYPNFTDTLYSDLCARCLHVQLCHRHSLLTEDHKRTLIEHILEKAALPWIRDASSETVYRPWPVCCVDILTAIVHHLTPVLQLGANQRRIVQLFGLLAHSETHMRDGSLVSWDLGEYLRSISGRVAGRQSDRSILCSDRPIPAPAIQCFIGALQAFHRLCRDSDELRAHWDRIGLPPAVEDWKYETDDELVAFLKMKHEAVGDERAGADLAVLDSVGGDGRDAMWWLNVCM